jgi:hypothetical protein
MPQKPNVPATKTATQHPKVAGTLIANFNGLMIYAQLTKGKRSGKDTVWIQIRQDAAKPYRMRECLAYARSVDIEFVT